VVPEAVVDFGQGQVVASEVEAIQPFEVAATRRTVAVVFQVAVE